MQKRQAYPPLAEVPAIVMCGGKGTRIREVTGDSFPKALLEVGGKNLLEHTLTAVRDNGMRHVILALSHQSARIKRELEHNPWPGLELCFSEVAVARGVLHALVVACREHRLDDTFLLIGADEICEGLELEPIYELHRAAAAAATMVLAAGVPEEERFVEAEIDGAGRVKGVCFEASPRSRTVLGYTFMQPEALEPISHVDPDELDDSLMLRELLPALIRARRLYGRVAAMSRYFHVGNPQSYHRACAELAVVGHGGGARWAAATA